MTTVQVIAISTLVTLAIISSGFFFMRSGFAHEWAGRHGHGWHQQYACRADHQDRLGKITEFVNSELNLNDAQFQAWDHVLSVVRLGQSKKDGLCKQYEQVKDKPAPDKLALVEQAVAEGLSLIQQLRPAFDGFYETLDEAQKAKVEVMLKRRHPLPMTHH